MERLPYTAVVEAELLSERNVAPSKHADRVLSVANLVDGLAVWRAAVAQAAGVVSVQNRVNRQDVVAVGVVQVTLESDIVEVRQIKRQKLGILALLDDILLFKPVPWPVNLSEVLDDQRVGLDPRFPFTENTQTF